MNEDEQRIEAQIADVTGGVAHASGETKSRQATNTSVEDVLASQPSNRNANGQARSLQDPSPANPLNNQFKGVMDQVRETVNMLRRGVGVRRYDGQAHGVAQQGNALLPAFRSASPSSWGGAYDSFRGNAQKPQSPQSQLKPIQPNGAQPAQNDLQPQQPAQPKPQFAGNETGAIGGSVARSYGVSVSRPAGLYGTSDSPNYSYNGARISIPDGFDLNDDNALKGYIEETNGLIDMMNRSYENEGV